MSDLEVGESEVDHNLLPDSEVDARPNNNGPRVEPSMTSSEGNDEKTRHRPDSLLHDQPTTRGQNWASPGKTYLGLPPGLRPLPHKHLRSKPSPASSSQESESHLPLADRVHKLRFQVGGLHKSSSMDNISSFSTSDQPARHVHGPDIAHSRSSTEGPSVSLLSPLPTHTQQALLECSRGAHPKLWYKFKRFETMSLLNLYHYQHELIELEQKITKRAIIPGIMEPGDRERLRKLLKEYHEAIQLFKEISITARPSMPQREETVETLSDVLKESAYSGAPDALALLDLTPQSLGVEPDSIRVLLHKTLPSIGLNKNGRAVTSFWNKVGSAEQGQQAYEHRTPGKGAKPKELFEGRPYAIKISSTVDNIARILAAFLAGLFLLVPMVALSYIQGKKYCLITTCLFVLLFAVVLSLASRASNQEVITATATYAAVLVVFVGQTTPSSGTA